MRIIVKNNFWKENKNGIIINCQQQEIANNRIFMSARIRMHPSLNKNPRPKLPGQGLQTV